MPDVPPRRLGDLLVLAGDASREEMERAAASARAAHQRLGEALLETGLVGERELFRVLAAQRGLPLAEVEKLLLDADPTLWSSVSARFLDRHHVVPVCRNDDAVIVATTDPDVSVPELAWALGGARVELALITPNDLLRLRRALQLGQAGRRAPARGSASTDDVLLGGDLDQELVALVDAILADAIGERASDVHLERYGEQVRVRLRVDGDLQDLTRYHLTPAQLLGLVNVLKVKGGMDIAERRLPQGGRFSIAAGDRLFDLRLQTQPSLHGEHVVIRLLPQDAPRLGIEQLGFSAALAHAFRRALDEPSGLVLVVGPTGSGKSTTLYAGLQVLSRDATRKVITVEDPIEYALDGVQQTQVRPEIGFHFADAMRAFVREDPDVILVGEIRDGETALEALRASQTGHLVLATLHCNDAVDAVQRLFDLGQHPNTIAAELRAVFAQRLAKRTCEACAAPARPTAARLAEVFPTGVPQDFTSSAGRGCGKCQGRGTYGRVAVVEHLPAGPALRTAIAAHAPLDALRETARRSGLAPFRAQALALVQTGVIAFDELRQLLGEEQLAER